LQLVGFEHAFDHHASKTFQNVVNYEENKLSLFFKDNFIKPRILCLMIYNVIFLLKNLKKLKIKNIEYIYDLYNIIKHVFVFRLH